MNAASCYRPVDLQLCQGDILERVPQLYLKDFPGPIRKTTGTGNRIVYELEELAPGVQATTPEEGILVPVHCHVTRAMLLQFFRFFARVELDPGIFETAACQEEQE